MIQLFRYLSIGLVPLYLVSSSIGCTSGGWCGNNQPAYPVGAYPLPGYPGGAYPNAGYPAGASGQPGVAPALNGQQAPSLPYGTPISPTYPPAGYPSGYPGGYPAAGYPQNQGVPLGSMAPGRPFIGQ